MPSNQFTSYSAHCSDKYGNLYFGTVGGITWFNPEMVADDDRTCPPLITGLRLFNVDVRPDDGTGLLSKHITLTDEIVLAHDQNSITISFTCPDYASEGKNAFKYRIEGVDDEWIEASSRSVTYSNLDKGNYCFELASANSDGVWDPRTRRLQIKVLPVWYQTIFAQLIFMLLLLLVGAYFLYRMKIHLDATNTEKMGIMEKRHEEDMRRARVSSKDPRTL